MRAERDLAREADPLWRAALRRELVWAIVAKLAALTLLWALFFRR
jgi:hypothetical protein